MNAQDSTSFLRSGHVVVLVQVQNYVKAQLGASLAQGPLACLRVINVQLSVESETVTIGGVLNLVEIPGDNDKLLKPKQNTLPQSSV